MEEGFVILLEDAGQRLDKLLALRLSLSRGEALALLQDGKVKVDDRLVSLRHKGRLLERGQRLSVAPFQTKAAAVIRPAPESPLSVLASLEGFIALDKPPGVAVFPHHPSETLTLLNAVAARYPQLQGVGEGGLRSGVVHRLDRDTSGALVVATEQSAWENWRAAFREHRVQKTYRALVQGRLEGRAREVMDLYVAQHRPAKVRVAAEPASGVRRCALSWRALELFEDATLLEVDLATGFLHQIRAMLAHKGHPVLGDVLYGNGETAPRQLLHAARLELEGFIAESPDPADFTERLETLRRAHP